VVGFVAPRRMQVRFDVCAPINQLFEAPVFSRLRGSVNGWARSAGDLRRAIASYAVSNYILFSIGRIPSPRHMHGWILSPCAVAVD